MITRVIDDLGRIVIPKDIRKAIGINSGDTMEISISNNSVVLTKHFETRIDELLSTDRAAWYEKCINETPAADVVEIVRCKNCKHATIYKCRNDPCYNRIICEYQIGTDDENFYCIYGEKRAEIKH